MAVTYTRTNWVDGTTTANAATLGNIEQGISDLVNAVNTSSVATKARPAYLTVASVDAPQYVKDGADYVCTGTADQVQINAALNRAAPLQSRNAAMPANAEQVGMVQLSGGRFNCSGSILMRTATTLEGVGMLSHVRLTGAGASPLVALAESAAHLTHLGKMYLDGNSTAGGTGNGVDYDMTGSGNTFGYPDINPDSDHSVYDLYIDVFTGGSSTRHGIYMHASSTANNRVNSIRDITMRDLSGNGIYLAASSDSTITNCSVGGVILGSGFYINTGNTRISNSKAAYCNTYGFYLASGRGTLSGIEVQDCATGIMFDGAPYVATGVTVDTCLNDGILVSTDRLVLNGFSVYNRSSGRYATSTNGLRFDVSTYADMIMTGQIDDPRITNKVVGTPGARSFMRVTNGSSLISVG